MAEPDAAGADDEPRDEPRPLIERVGLGLIALVFAVVFGGLSLGAFASGEVFLGTMAGIGGLMTIWAAVATIRR
jgi:hypothetical protein